jgi:hypothetical protein
MQVQKTTIAFTITVHNQIFAENPLAKRSVCHFLGQANGKPETAPIFSSWGPWTRLSEFRICGRAVSQVITAISFIRSLPPFFNDLAIVFHNLNPKCSVI